MSGTTVASIDGAQVPLAEARVSILDRGFLYGDSVFEVMRVHRGVAFRQRAHLERLARSAESVFIELPVTVEALATELRAALEASGLRDAYVRLILTRGQGPLTFDRRTASAPRRVVLVAPLPELAQSLYTEGVTAALVHVSRPAVGSRSRGVKASNYLANLLALEEARSRGAHDAILVEPDGMVTEAASSNVFVVRDGRVLTPRLEAGILSGITRGVVIERAGALGVPVEEGLVFPSDLYRADEVFLTSSVRELVSVVRVDGREVGVGAPGPVAARLREAYRAEVRRETGG
ncbi:MAG: aminotransferase class IV [Myxococcales bacterium]|nr:aminotransferase class IV [Myxococcales bacterium]